MTRLLTLILALFICLGCTKQDVIDTGTAKAAFDGNIMEYLRQDTYNWQLTVAMIERAGLTAVFEGKVDSLKEITFFGPTSYSILRYLYDNGMEDVSELSPEFCKESILKYIVKGKYLKESFPYRDRQFLIFDIQQPATGYKELKTLGGNTLRAYNEKTDYGNVPDVGPVIMYLYAMDINLFVPLASPNIQPDNGVVHSLNYNFKFNYL